MYHILAIMSAAIAVLLLWKALRHILERLERIEEAGDALSGRVAMLEDSVAMPSMIPTVLHAVMPTMPPDAKTASVTSDDAPPPIVHQQQQEDASSTELPVPQVTEVITLIDGIDDDAKHLRKELRKRGLPARGGIDEMRARLAKAGEEEGVTTSLVEPVQ